MPEMTETICSVLSIMPWISTKRISSFHLLLTFLVQQILCSEGFHNKPIDTEATVDSSWNRDAFTITVPSNFHARLSLSKTC